MKNGFSRGSRQQAKASRPDGFIPRRRLAKERAGSAKNITPKREASKIETRRSERINGGIRQHEFHRQA